MRSETNGIPTEIKAPQLRAFIGDLPVVSATQVNEQLVAASYRWQANARDAVSRLVDRHMRRLRLQFVNWAPPHLVPRRDACLLTGPSGSGKTYLLHLLRDEIADVPVLLIDAASLTDCVSVDHVVSRIVSRLVDSAPGYEWPSCGFICVDGLERVSCSLPDGGSSEAASEWMWRNWRVQQGLLTLLTSSSVDFNHERGLHRTQRTCSFPLASVSLVACGSLDESGSGFLPQLMQQFNLRARLAPLGRAELLSILAMHVEWNRRALQIAFDPPPQVLARIVDSALATGAGIGEALRAFERLVDDACLQAAGDSR